MLVCPVRGCQLALVREARRLVCARGHSFDVARSGYVNLLQPQDRKSKEPGDTLAAIEGRRRLHERGVTAPLLDAIVEVCRAGPDDVVLDAGCGEGFYLGNLQRLSRCSSAHGVDISISAVDAAAKRYASCEWIVANADRQLPYADGSFSLVLSITARMNPTEFRRVLRPDGRLLVAIPGPEDLRELRGGLAGRDRVERTVAMFAGEFSLQEQRRVSITAALDAAGVADVRHAIYMPGSGEAVERVTFSLDLLLFRANLA